MDLEEQTLRYYLKVFSITFFIFFLFINFYVFYIFNKKIYFSDNVFNIEKGESLERALNNNTINLNNTEIYLIKIYFLFNKILNDQFIHYGEFIVDNEISLNSLLNIITKPSNVLNKITIIEGWSQRELNQELSKYFKNTFNIPYEDIIADTYYFEKNQDFTYFVKKLNKIKKQYFNNYKNNKLLTQYSDNQIMIIGSLLEKEGLDKDDKKMISSVIFNRLNYKMKLQIDATVLFAITNGKYNLKRKILLSDLKIDHLYNTYKNYGLPPKPISYVGKKTLEIVFENYKTDFLFYFFNNSLNKHIFSKNYKDHKTKLNEYRN